MSFQIVQLELDADNEVVERKLLPHFSDSREEAMRLAEEAAKKCSPSNGYREEDGYWWARDSEGKSFRFIVE